MDINGLQIASIIFSVSMAYFAYYCYRKKYFGLVSLFVWTLIFILLIFTTIFPEIFAPFKSIFKVARLFDLFTVIGLFFLVVLTFINFIHLQGLKKKLGHYVQQDALHQHKNHHNTEGEDTGKTTSEEGTASGDGDIL
jgi:hypothetical protein